MSVKIGPPYTRRDQILIGYTPVLIVQRYSGCKDNFEQKVPVEIQVCINPVKYITLLSTFLIF
jgi:hypothetical protein